MAVGMRLEGRQGEMFVVASEIRRLSHPFYEALERMLETVGFDAFAEAVNRRRGVFRSFFGHVQGSSSGSMAVLNSRYHRRHRGAQAILPGPRA